MSSGDEKEVLKLDSVLNIRYQIKGDRTVGAHTPFAASASSQEVPLTNDAGELLYKSALVLQRPVFDPCLAVGFLPLPSDGLRVGQLVSMKWRVERIKDLKENFPSANKDEVLYEIKANAVHWMIAGRKRGHVSLSKQQGARILISIICVPLVAGFVRPPQLGLPEVDDDKISCNPANPHLVCVLPPPLSSSFCVAV